MARMTVSGRRERIPPFPHHKYNVQQSRRFFFARSAWDHLLLGKGIALREMVRGVLLRCYVPRLLLVDPTSRCDLHCTGCWAADYGRTDELSYEELDSLFAQARRLGIMYCNLSGGEPLMRKDDLLRLFAKHRRMIYGIFTNGTRVDADFADAIARLGNVNLYLSIEGWREETDFRRGPGAYDRVLAAMDLLRERGIGFAFSICYHARNWDVVSSDAYLDFLREKGAWFGWMFQYVPVGKDADPSLVLSPEQRAEVKRRVDAYAERHGFVLVDFWNNGHLVHGCAAAGIGFVHVNARGDVEPCAFCHYSDSNIREKTLVEALRSPFFRRFRKAQPFDANPLRGCPLMNHPEALAAAVREGGAHSTHLHAPESPEELGAKTAPIDAAWRKMAERLQSEETPRKRRHFATMLKLQRWKKGWTDP